MRGQMQVAQVADICALGVLGPTPLDTKMAGKGLEGAEAVCVHDLTLTKPRSIGKDIGNVVLRVLAVA